MGGRSHASAEQARSVNPPAVVDDTIYFGSDDGNCGGAGPVHLAGDLADTLPPDLRRRR
ncbi:MAG: hypothetical protein OXH96_01810 [Spirochaetaceae bacterium]|nr:hypothetical protein [Spirochaetaceae bacterium]